MHTAYLCAAAYLAGAASVLLPLMLIPGDTETSLDRMKRQHQGRNIYRRVMETK